MGSQGQSITDVCTGWSGFGGGVVPTGLNVSSPSLGGEFSVTLNYNIESYFLCWITAALVGFSVCWKTRPSLASFCSRVLKHK